MDELLGKAAHEDSGPKLPLPEPQESLPPLPKQIRKYRIEGVLDRGGMSILYLGVHPETNESIIVKVLSPKYVSNGEVALRFLNEAKIISLADHPNIVKLYDYGQWEGGLYIAMEFIRGTSLRKILASQPFSLKRALEVILQTSYALCHLHTHGIIHGDLKPENVLITDAGCVKVIDFGIAKILSDKIEEGGVRRVIGTPIYMSPEQRYDPQQITFRSDIYSLGILAYELVLGKITHGRVILSLAPKGIQHILSKALQPKPEDRYQDIVDFISDVSNYINSTDVHKDKQGSDYFFELFESLETAQNYFLPENLPAWPDVEIGASHVVGMGLHGLFYDYFTPSPHKGSIFIALTSAKGGVGVLRSAMIRAQTKLLMATLGNDPIDKLLTTLEEHAKKDIFEEKFDILNFFLDFQEKTFEYYSKQYGMLLLRCKKEEQALFVTQIPSIQVPGYGHSQGSFSSGDRFLLIGYKEKYTDKESVDALHLALQRAFKESIDLSCQKQVDLILRKLRVKGYFPLTDQPLCMFCIQIK